MLQLSKDDVLTGANWYSFQAKFRNLVTAKYPDMADLFVPGAVQTVKLGIKQEGSSDTPDTRRAEKERLDRQLKSILFNNVADSYQHLVDDASTAAAAWSALEQECKSITSAAEVGLTAKLSTIKVQENETASALVERGTKIFRQLQAAGSKVTEHFAVSMIANALPGSRFDYIRGRLTEEQIPLDKFTTMVQKTEVYKRGSLSTAERKEQSEKSGGAFTAQRGRGGNSDRGRGRGRGGLGGRGRGRRGGRGGGNSGDGCHRCGADDHWVADCPHPVGYQQQQQQPQQRQPAVSATSTAAAAPATPAATTASRPQYGKMLTSICAAATSSHGDNSSPVLDSGAFAHASPDLDLLHDFTAEHENIWVKFGNGEPVRSRGIGDMYIDTGDDIVKVEDVYFFPEAPCNLLSVESVFEKHPGANISRVGRMYHLTLDGERVFTASKRPDTGVPHIHGIPIRVDGSTPQPRIAVPAPQQPPQQNVPREADIRKAKLVHRSLGHPAYSTMTKPIFLRDHSLTKEAVLAAAEEPCEACLTGKMTRLPFHPSESATSQPLKLLHMDVVGPITPVSQGGTCYIATLYDDYTGFSEVALLSSKRTVPKRMRRLLLLWETLTGCKVRAVRTDRGREYVQKRLDNWLAERGIQHQTSAPRTPQQNGKAERLNRTLKEKVRCMLADSGQPLKLWGEAMQTANRARNCTPASDRPASPWELFYQQPPPADTLHPFGCRAIVHIHEDLRDSTMECTGDAGVYVGYEANSKAYRVLLDNGKIVISRHVTFCDDIMPARGASAVADPGELVEDPAYDSGSDSDTSGSDYESYSSDMESDAGDDSDGDDGDDADGGAGGASNGNGAGHSSADGSGASGANNGNGAGHDSAAPNDNGNGAGHDSAAPNDNGSGANASGGSGAGHTAGASASGGSGANGNSGGNGSAGPSGSAGGGSSGTATFGSGRFPVRVRAPNFKYQHPQQRGSASSGAQVTAGAITLARPVEPRTFEEAISGPNKEQWQGAMDSEMHSLASNKTWSLVKRPPGVRPIPVKWVYKVKVDAKGYIDRFKARLVAKGFMQVEGVDFDEVFAPTSKYTTMRAFMAIVAHYDMELKHLDVKTAFLNGELDTPIYLQQPPGYEQGDSDTVCLLHKTLYGLRQAPRAWHLRLNAELLKLGFTPSDADPSLYSMQHSDGQLVFVLVYVDDILYASRSAGRMQLVKEVLMTTFDSRDLGEASYFLGMQVERDRLARTIRLSQERMVRELAEQYGMASAKGKAVPISPGTILHSATEEDELLDTQRYTYSALVGSLLHLAACTRPDIAQAVGVLSRYMSKPTMAHWRQALNVVRYLASTAALGLTLGGGRTGLLGYNDSDFAGNPDNRKSTTGYVYLLHGGAISWSSKQQPTVAVSTQEAEYMATGSAIKEALWLRKLMVDRGESVGAVQLFGDNTASLQLLKNPVVSMRSKHIDIVHHFARERIARGEVEYAYCNTEVMVADIMTKPLPQSKFEWCRNAMGVF